jgi:MFS family permease
LGFASPALAAALLELGSWRWIFLIMVPICLVALVAGWRTLPRAIAPAPLIMDWVTTGLLVLAVGCVLAAVSDISATSVYLVVLGLATGGLLWWRSRREPSPVLDPRFLTTFPYGHLAAATALTLAAMGGLSAYLPVYVRGARGGSASLAAWSVLWMTIGWTFAANVAGRVTDRVSERAVLTVGALIGPFALTAAWASVSGEAPLPGVFAAFFLMGTSVGTVTNASLQLVRKAAPPAIAGRATSAHLFLRTMGLTLGAGLAGGVILASVAARLPDISRIREALAGEGSALTGPAASALAAGYGAAHLAALGLMSVALAVVLIMRRRPLV